MGTGQTLITILAIALLGAVILSTNRQIFNSSGVLLQTNYGLEATSLAMSTIEEAEYLAFDNSTLTSSDSVTSQLTPVNRLGYEGTGDDTLPDDFDDYNGAPGGTGRVVIDSEGTGAYKVKTKVCYVNWGDFSVSNSPTWLKKMDVWVWNTVDSLDTVHLSTVYAYWYFR